MTFGSEDWWSRGRKVVVVVMMEIIFALNVVLKFSRMSDRESLFGRRAMPALLMRTISHQHLLSYFRLMSGKWKRGTRRRTV